MRFILRVQAVSLNFEAISNVAADSSFCLLLYCDLVSFKFVIFKLRIRLFWIIVDDVLYEYQLIFYEESRLFFYRLHG